VIRACLEACGFAEVIERFRGAAAVHVDGRHRVKAARTECLGRARSRPLFLGSRQCRDVAGEQRARWSWRLSREADAGRLLTVVDALV